ncbi:MAG: sporulation initiation factor Spo0A C-terminal domain-containing protein [Clostridia bacterium]|nr:sporulation initiation factor Spo0A C-terminal domain-containing protein [Clostridia bacterium]
MIKIVLIINNNRERDSIARAIRRDGRFQLLGVLESFGTLLELSDKVSIQCVICEPHARDMDYIECAQRLRYKLGNSAPRIILLCSTISSSSFERMLCLGATDVIRSTGDTSMLLDRIATDNQEPTHLMLREAAAPYNNPEKEIKRWLMRLEISPKLIGHKYLMSAVTLCLADPDMLYNVSKNLYVEIADSYDTRPENVERAIRHSISVMWKNASPNHINELFNNPLKSKGKRPTNCEMIAAIYERANEVRILQESLETPDEEEPPQ